MLPVRPLSSARVAVVHEWLYTYAGAEKVLEQILDLFPNAEIFSLIDFLPEKDRHILGGRKVHTSFLQKMPLVRKKHQWFLPLMPLAIEKFNLSSFDIILTSSYAVAKGVLTGPNQLHICYCHSPVRYAWDLQHQYLYQWHIHRGLRSLFAIWVLNKLRIWDHVGSNGVDRFIANSRFISRRIWKTYRRDSKVIHPPVDTSFFVPDSPRGDTYVTVSRLVGYKRVDLLVETFRQLPDRKLVVIGAGENLDAL
ncbi:MAG TPA: glycosyltransferase, partial [Fibrobacteria bacterium]|nr:glycosyltransferase [Fibrobacteria bacterium]